MKKHTKLQVARQIMGIISFIIVFSFVYIGIINLVANIFDLFGLPVYVRATN